MALDFVLADTLQQFGFMDLILPFMLIFVIIFGILQKVKIFGDGVENKKFNIVIAMVMGLMVVVPHSLRLYPPGRDPVDIMLGAIPNVSIVLVAILMALLIIGILGKKVELGNTSLSGWIAMLAFAIVIYIFGGAAGWWQTFGGGRGGGLSPDLTALVVTVLVFAIIIWFITNEPKDSKDDSEKFGKKISEALFSGGK